MFPRLTQRIQSTQLGEQRALGLGAAFSNYEDKFLNRRNVLTAGLAISACGWLVSNRCEGTEEGLRNDSSPMD